MIQQHPPSRQQLRRARQAVAQALRAHKQRRLRLQLVLVGLLVGLIGCVHVHNTLAAFYAAIACLTQSLYISSLRNGQQKRV